MTGAFARLFNHGGFVPQDAGALAADDRLAADLATALAEQPGVNAVTDAGHAAWEQRGGTP